MLKFLVPVALSIFMSIPANASNLEDLNRELKKLHDLIAKQDSVLREVVNGLPDQTIENLYNTQIGEEGMSEADVIDLGMSHILTGNEALQFYIDHLSKPIQVDAVGQKFR